MKSKKIMLFLSTIFLSVGAFFCGQHVENSQYVLASSSEREYVYPCGSAVGICIYTDGLLVTAVSDITDNTGKTLSPAKEAGIKKGDRILYVDENKIKSIEEFTNYLSKKNNSVTITACRQNQVYSTTLTAVNTNEGPKIGVWVRDSTAGIGTVTFYNPDNQTFGALGHSIADIDTQDILTIRQGNILSCDMSLPSKGERGSPGELNGAFSQTEIGTIEVNEPIGIYGKIQDKEKLYLKDKIAVAKDEEVLEGSAYILADVDGKGVKSYDVEIKKVTVDSKDSKNLVLKITSDELIKKTGGIVQGMSGAPIVQNGMLVGAVTHVFINDPEKGYGILASRMVKQSKDM